MPKKKFGELRTSLFLITINTNQTVRSEDELIYWANLLERGIEKAVDSLDEIILFLSENAKSVEENDGTEDDINSNWLLDEYPNPEVRYAIEIGESANGGRIHAHIVMRIKHYSKIHMNREGWQKIMIDYLNLDNVYINFKGLPDTQKNLDLYLKKTYGKD